MTKPKEIKIVLRALYKKLFFKDTVLHCSWTLMRQRPKDYTVDV